MTPLRWLIDLIRGAHPAEQIAALGLALFVLAHAVPWLLLLLLARDASAAPSCAIEVPATVIRASEEMV